MVVSILEIGYQVSLGLPNLFFAAKHFSEPKEVVDSNSKSRPKVTRSRRLKKNNDLVGSICLDSS